MFSPTGRVTVFRPKELRPKKLPKSLVAVFVLAQLFTGINFGFFAAVSSKRLRTLANILSALSALLVFTSYIYNFDRWDNSVSFYAAEFLIIMITTHLSNYNLFNFLTDLVATDTKFNINLNSHFGLKTLLLIVFGGCYRVAMSVIFCISTECSELGSIFMIMYVIFEMRQLFAFVLKTDQALVYYVIYLRVKFLRSSFGQGELDTKQVGIIMKSLAGSLKKNKVSHDTVIVAGYVTDFLKNVAYLWDNIKNIKLIHTWNILVFVNYVNIIHMLLLPCGGPLVAEMITTQIEELKLLIHERLLIGSSADEELLRLLHYVEARPLIQKAWRLVPVDLRLPVSLLSMTITYLVVLVQLTHLY